MAVDPGAQAPPRAVPKRVWMAAVATTLGLAGVAALLSPLMALPDEPAHAIHAAAVAGGTVAGVDAVATDPATGWTRTETTVDVPRAYADLATLPTCFAFRPTASADCAPAVDDSAGPVVPASTTVGTYAPAWYAAVGWPSRLLPPPLALYAMRFVAAMAFAGLLGAAVASLWRVGARHWGLVGLALAVPPVAVHLGGGLNPSGTEIAAAVALWAGSIELARCSPSRAAVARWAIAGVVVAVVRPLGPAIAVGIPAVTWAALGGPRARHRPWRDPSVRGGVVAVVVAVVVALGWTLWRGTLSAFSGFPDPDATLTSTLRHSLGLVPERLVEMVGVLGWSDVSLPRIVVAAWLVATGVVVIAAFRGGDRRLQGLLALLGLGVLVLPIVADLRSAASIGFVWQGRYTLPIAAGLPVLAGMALDRRAAATGGVWPATVLGAVALGHVVALLAVARRFGSGADAEWVASLDPTGWSPPVPVVVLLLVAVAALATPVVAMALGSRGRTTVTG